MKIGSICLSSNQGLGYLARDFYRNGIIDEVLLQRHPSLINNPDWFNKDDTDIPILPGYPFAKKFDTQTKKKAINFLKKINLLILFEVPFCYEIFSLAKQLDVKVVMFPMYEITPYPMPCDNFLTNSDLDYEYYKKMYPKARVDRINIPIPNEIVWKKRNVAEVFVHNSGNGGTYERNNTNLLLRSMKLVKSPIKLIVRSQQPVNGIDDSRVEVVNKSVKFEELWSIGDVFIFPEKFNGLSLPLQEAYASGMAVMCGKRFPMTEWLPNEIMIPISGYETRNITNVKFKSAIYNEKSIARTIDLWYNKSIEDLSLSGRQWALKNNWNSMKPKYISLFEEIINE